MLFQVKYATHDEYIVVENEEFCYVSLTAMVENHAVDRDDYAPEGNEIYFCYDMNETWWIEIASGATSSIPVTSGETIVHGVNVKVDYVNNKFMKA